MGFGSVGTPGRWAHSPQHLCIHVEHNYTLNIKGIASPERASGEEILKVQGEITIFIISWSTGNRGIFKEQKDHHHVTQDICRLFWKRIEWNWSVYEKADLKLKRRIGRELLRNYFPLLVNFSVLLFQFSLFILVQCFFLYQTNSSYFWSNSFKYVNVHVHICVGLCIYLNIDSRLKFNQYGPGIESWFQGMERLYNVQDTCLAYSQPRLNPQHP